MKEEIIAAEQAASLPKSLSEVAPPSAAASSATGAVVAAVSARMGHLRWSICALLFFATTINYVDRQGIGNFYRWFECWRDCRSAHGSLDRAAFGLAMGVHLTRRYRFGVARILDSAVCAARSACANFASRPRSH